MRIAQVNDHAEVALPQSADDVVAAAYLHAHIVDLIAGHLERRRHVAVRQRYLDAAFDLVAADGKPEQRAQRERGDLESHVSERMPGHQASSSRARSSGATMWVFCRMIVCSSARRSSVDSRR